VIDELAIQQTISRYHEGASKPDLEQLIATFLPDGTWEVPAFEFLCNGHAEMREVMSAVLAPIEYLVQINAPAIIAVDGDTASARTLVRECAKYLDRPGLVDVVGQFVDELQRTPDGWRFARRTFTILGTNTSEGR
jgi:ketosteroid isomerase-like protein